MNLTNYVKSFDQSDLSALIQNDAQDTVDKISQAMEWVSYMMQFDASDIDITAGEKFYLIFNAYDVTILLGDGRILQMQYNIEHQYLASIFTRNGETVTNYIWQSGLWLDGVDELYLLGGTRVSPEEVLTSLTAQQQSSIVMARLAALTRGDSVDISTILATLNDMSGYFTPDVSDFLSTLMDLGPALNPATLLSSLTRVYTPYGSAAATDDAIEFNNTKYGLKSFYGTCIKGALMTGAQILASVFMVAGGVIGAILGAVGSAIAYGYQALTAGGPLSTKAQLNVGANHYEYAQPVCQRTIPFSNLEADIQERISTYGVIAIKLPSITLYVWQNGSDAFVEGYLTAGQRAFPNGENELLANRFLIFQGSDFNDEDGAPQTITFYATYDADVTQAYDPNNIYKSRFCPFATVTRWTSTDATDSQANRYFSPTMGEVTDADLRMRVWSAAITTYWAIKNAEFSFGRLVWDPDDVNPQIPVGTATWNGAYDFIFSDEFIRSLFFYNDVSRPWSERLPTWDDLTNRICPALMTLFNDMGDSDFFHFVSTERVGSNKAYMPTYMNAYVRQVDSFRNNFAITPPEFDEGELLTSVIVSAVSVAVVAGVAATATAITKRAIRSAAAKRQAKADEAYYAYIDPESSSYQDKTILSKYLKNSRKAEKLSGLLGGSGFVTTNIESAGGNLDAALGSVVTTEVVSELIGGDLEGAVSEIVGSVGEGEQPVELSTLVRLIKGD